MKEILTYGAGIVLAASFGCITPSPRFSVAPVVEEKTVSEVVVTDEMVYDSAVAYFKLKNFDSCEAKFRSLIDSFPQSVSAEKASYMLGYLYTCSDNPKLNYTTARTEFENFAKKFPDSRYVSDSKSWIKLIETYEALLKKGNAPIVNNNNNALMDENKKLKAENLELKALVEKLQKIIEKN